MPRPETSAVGKPVLAKNKACMRCRKRKMKCDGEQPCAPCIHAQQHGRDYVPECTYETPQAVPGPVRPSIHQLKERIQLLESMLEEQQRLQLQSDEFARSFLQTAMYTRYKSPPIPPLLVIQRLADIFFRVIVLADRMVHRQTFFTNLQLPEEHPDYPNPILLHTICAAGGFFIRSISKPEPSDFADEHITWMVKLRERAMTQDVNHMPCLISLIVQTWLNYFKGVPPERCALHSDTVRFVAYLNLSKREYDPILGNGRVLTPGQVIELETRRNMFWLVYGMERWEKAILTTPVHTLMDRDITQYLPLTESQFNSGTYVNPDTRQHMCSPDLLVSHPQGLDAFTMWTKICIVISGINDIVIRADYGDEDEAIIEAKIYEAETTLQAFQTNLPSGDFANDPGLYLAHVVSYVGMIILHQSADVSNPKSPRTLKLLHGAQGVAGIVHLGVMQASESTKIDSIMSTCWLFSARTFIRFLVAAIEAGNMAQATQYKRTVEYIRRSLYTVGDRYHLDYKKFLALDEMLRKVLADRSIAFNRSLGDDEDALSATSLASLYT